MEDTAVTRVDDQNYKILSCLEVASIKKGGGDLKEDGIEELIEPLAWERCSGDSIQAIKSKIKTFVSGLFDLPNGKITKTKCKGDNGKEYTALCQRVGPVIFAFLMLPLSDEEFREIEKNSVGKTYLTGDPADMFKTKEDFN